MSVYIPRAFIGTDDTAIRVMSEFPFATVVTLAQDHVPQVSHIPLLVEPDLDGKPILIGHLARANPHWRLLADPVTTYVYFHGPHTYVSPSWYTSGRDVPTWNYVVVHAEGRAELIEEPDEIVAIVRRLTTRFEADRADPWEFALPGDLPSAENLSRAIVGVRLRPTKLSTKVKLGQNRSPADQAGVAHGLDSERRDDLSRTVAEWMRRGQDFPGDGRDSR